MKHFRKKIGLDSNHISSLMSFVNLAKHFTSALHPPFKMGMVICIFPAVGIMYTKYPVCIWKIIDAQ